MRIKDWVKLIKALGSPDQVIGIRTDYTIGQSFIEYDLKLVVTEDSIYEPAADIGSNDL